METGPFVVAAGSLNILHMPVSIPEYLAAATGSRIVCDPAPIRSGPGERLMIYNLPVLRRRSDAERRLCKFRGYDYM
jgi:hypothetical protein